MASLAPPSASPPPPTPPLCHRRGAILSERFVDAVVLCGLSASGRVVVGAYCVVYGRWMDGRRWWFHQPVRHGSMAVTLDTDGGFARFSVGGDTGTKQKAGRRQPPAKAKAKMSRKAKVNQLKWYRLKAKNKMKPPNPEVRIIYKLKERKEEWLIEKLRKYEVPRSPEPVHDPEILTEEEKFYLKRTGEKKKKLYSCSKERGVWRCGSQHAPSLEEA